MMRGKATFDLLVAVHEQHTELLGSRLVALQLVLQGVHVFTGVAWVPVPPGLLLNSTM